MKGGVNEGNNIGSRDIGKRKYRTGIVEKKLGSSNPSENNYGHAKLETRLSVTQNRMNPSPEMISSHIIIRFLARMRLVVTYEKSNQSCPGYD